MSETNNPVMLKRTDSFRGSVDELVTWCIERGLEPAEVQLTGTHLKYLSVQTSEEAERRASYAAEAKRRHDEWERRTYERLRDKLEDAPDAEH